MLRSSLIGTLALCHFLIANVSFGVSNEVPGAPQSKPIAIVGAAVYPVSKPPVENATLLFEGGKIKAIGVDVEIPKHAQRIEAKGKRVYPGLIDAFSNMGLVEVNSIRATMDGRELGSYNPNVKAWVAVNPDSEIIPVTRANGVLIALTTPTGGLISGRSALIQLDGWTIEDMVLRTDVGMHIDWPASRRFIDSGTGESIDASAGSSGGIKSLRDFWEQSAQYMKARKAAPDDHLTDLRYEAMIPVLEGKLPLIVTAESIREIRAAVGFAVEQGVKLVIYGGYDAPLCADLLKQHDVPVIVAGTYRLPMRESDPYDTPYTVPERLRQAGVKYCIASIGKFGASGVRNLPFHAANAVAFGLPEEEALRAITTYPAEILGVANRVGSLDEGKDATLILCNGDPLDPATQVEGAYIQGRIVELNDRHKRLWHKYEKKYKM